MHPSFLLDELEEIIYVSDIDNHELLYVNKATLNKLGVTLTQALGRKCFEVIQGRTTPCPFCTNALLKEGETYVWEFTNQYINRHFMLRDKLIPWGDSLARMEIAIDITEKENISRDLTSKLEVEEMLIEATRLLISADDLDIAIPLVLKNIGQYYQADRAYIFEMDDEHKICSNSYEWCRDGIKSQILVLQNISYEAIVRWREEFQRNNHVVIRDLEEIRTCSPLEYEILKGQAIHAVCVVPLLSDGAIIGYIGVDNPHRHGDEPELLNSLSYFLLSEISKRTMQKRLRFIDKHDTLTGLNSLNRYSDFLQETQGVDFSSVGIAVGDINGLKQINEDYGHRYGDDMIQEIATALRSGYDSENLYRISGDEFLVVCPNMPRAEFLQRLELVKEKVRYIGVSFGWIWEDTEIDIERLAHKADGLMRVEKLAYYENLPVAGKHHDPQRLRSLLEQLEAGNFLMYLQPKFDLETGQLIGAEALTRMNHPSYGLLYPNKFIPVLEKSNLIRYVDLYIYEQVCKQLAKWVENGWKIMPISLNFSRITMMEDGLLGELLRIHKKYPVPREFIEIEITESVGSIGRESIAEIAHRIKEHRFLLSLDDFGSYYSSLSILSVVDFDVLKLDKSLIHNLVENKSNQAIVRHIIGLCKELCAKTIAEGVETEEQLQMLKLFGCNAAQGYYYDKPIAVAQFEEKYLQGRGI